MPTPELAEIPYQIELSAADGWCIHPTAVHQDVPGCGRICSDSTNKGSKDQGTWGPWESTSVNCPAAKLDEIWHVVNGIRTLKVGSVSTMRNIVAKGISSDDHRVAGGVASHGKAAVGGVAKGISSDDHRVAGGVASHGIGSALGVASHGKAQSNDVCIDVCKAELISPNGVYKAVTQGDGNFVVYKSGQAIWASGTNGKGTGPYKTIMQTDGNLVLYDSNGVATWDSGSNNKGSMPFKAIMQNDGNLVVYSSTGATWSSQGG